MRQSVLLAMSLLTGLPLSACRTERVLEMGENGFQLAVGDLNDDGHADLVVASPTEPSGYGFEPEQLLVRLGTGLGGFGELLRSPGTPTPADLLLADFDGDSNLDAASIVSYGYLWTFTGEGDGSFRVGVPLTAACDTRSPGGEAGDFDGDGMSDVAVLCLSSGPEYMVTLFARSGPALELGERYTSNETSARAVASGDLNGDGAIDLAIAGTHSGVSGLIPHLNDGTGRFAAQPPVPAPNAAIELADLNGDGTLDAATSDDFIASATDATLAILSGNGDGTFGEAHTVLSGEPIEHLATGDLDADGLADIAAIGGGELHLFVAVRAGEYARRSLPAGENPVDLAIADLDQDGRDDVAVLNRTGPSTVTIHFDAAPRTRPAKQ